MMRAASDRHVRRLPELSGAPRALLGRRTPLTTGGMRQALGMRMEPEVRFEPTTFRLRDGCSASPWSASDGSSLLTLPASSVQTAPDGYRRIVWMIIGMITGHPTETRMARK